MREYEKVSKASILGSLTTCHHIWLPVHYIPSPSPFFIALLIKGPRGASGRLLVAPPVFAIDFLKLSGVTLHPVVPPELLEEPFLNTSLARKDFANCF